MSLRNFQPLSWEEILYQTSILWWAFRKGGHYKRQKGSFQRGFPQGHCHNSSSSPPLPHPSLSKTPSTLDFSSCRTQLQSTTQACLKGGLLYRMSYPCSSLHCNQLLHALNRLRQIHLLLLASYSHPVVFSVLPLVFLSSSYQPFHPFSPQHQAGRQSCPFYLREVFPSYNPLCRASLSP